MGTEYTQTNNKTGLGVNREKFKKKKKVRVETLIRSNKAILGDGGSGRVRIVGKRH